jgi:cell wall-associated NlpC family hydrolase
VISKKQVVDQARKFVGRKFHHQGRYTFEGFDCLGIVLSVGEELELRDTRGERILRTDYRDYGSQPIGNEMLRQCRLRMIERQGGSAAPRQLADVLVMRLPDDPTHMAIVTELGGLPAIVHAYAGGSGRVVEHVLDFSWIRRIAGVFRFPGVEE